MKRYQVAVTPEAEADIRGIYRYIADELENPQAAFRQSVAIYDAIASLDVMPNRHPVWRNEPWKSRGVHFITVDHYNVFYTVDTALAEVVALRVFYCGRNV